MLAPSQQKDQKIKQIQKNERKALWTDPEIPNSRSPDSRFGRESGEGIPDSRFGRNRESGNPP
jgi:hypothetical protein